MANPEVKAFADAYNHYFTHKYRIGTHQNATKHAIFDVLSTPIKRV